MDDAQEGGKLNPSQQRHLLSSCQHADKLLSEIEAVLSASQSKSPFPKFQPDISPAQAKLVRDYSSQMRAQMVRILDSLGVEIPTPFIGSVHSVRVTLGFIDIAFEECRPRRMAGYGEVADDARTELAGLVDEMQGIVSRLDGYLAQGQSADLEERLERLEEAGGDIGLVKALERAIHRHGLVEFRPALAAIVERLESKSFEIAVFGRVSCGKSSLLNHIVGQDVLPVGVNPITAVPTRLAYGSDPRATAWFADRGPEQFAIERVAEFVTEQRNPANIHHVTRIVVELPSARLAEGIVYVDTPGLGSLATSGAAETKAYLPKCDLGVVLIDAGSTLTLDDLATVQALYDAGIPASVLLSKADVLAPADCERARQYAAEHIRTELGSDLPVHAVSVKTGYAHLLEQWLDAEILPLYGRHAELARQSLARKIGALRLGVEAALNARMRRRGHSTGMEPARVRELEIDLRTAAGKIAEARTECIEMSDKLRNSADDFVGAAAAAVIDAWAASAGSAADKALVKTKLELAGAEAAARIASVMRAAALHAGRALVKTGKSLNVENRPEPDEAPAAINSMPRFDLGNVEIHVGPSVVASMLGRRWAVRRLQRQVLSQAGQEIDASVAVYARVVQAWVRETFKELQERFDSYAGAYRAQLDRLLDDGAESIEDDETVRNELAAFAAAAPCEAVGQDAP